MGCSLYVIRPHFRRHLKGDMCLLLSWHRETASASSSSSAGGGTHTHRDRNPQEHLRVTNSHRLQGLYHTHAYAATCERPTQRPHQGRKRDTDPSRPQQRGAAAALYGAPANDDGHRVQPPAYYLSGSPLFAALNLDSCQVGVISTPLTGCGNRHHKACSAYSVLKSHLHVPQVACWAQLQRVLPTPARHSQPSQTVSVMLLWLLQIGLR